MVNPNGIVNISSIIKKKFPRINQSGKKLLTIYFTLERSMKSPSLFFLWYQLSLYSKKAQLVRRHLKGHSGTHPLPQLCEALG